MMIINHGQLRLAALNDVMILMPFVGLLISFVLKNAKSNSAKPIRAKIIAVFRHPD